MGNQEQLTDDNQEQLTDDDQEQLTDDDSDQELRRVLKHLGVMRVGGRWEKREEWREERASPNDSSSESSDAEDADIDRKMDALLQGVSKSCYCVTFIPIKYSNFSRFYEKMGPFYKIQM